jgi:hypothetical protein
MKHIYILATEINNSQKTEGGNQWKNSSKFGKQR